VATLPISEERLFTFMVENEAPVRRHGAMDLIVPNWLVVTYSQHTDPDYRRAWIVRCVEVTGYRAKRDGSAGQTAARATWWSPGAPEFELWPEWLAKLITANMPM
jgi:hypothetical protein